MKRRTVLIMILTAGVFLTAGFTFMNRETGQAAKNIKGIVIDIPEDVQAVIDKSCFTCHNSEAGNHKAKLNLQFDKFKTGEYSPGKVVGKLNKIIETLDEESMPPKKFKEKYPDKVMSNEEVKLLRTWADENIKKLIEE